MSQITHGHVRGIVKQWLIKLDEELAQFDQTTHGLIGSFTIESVLHYIAKMYNDPSAYTISSASQAIHAFLIHNK